MTKGAEYTDLAAIDDECGDDEIVGEWRIYVHYTSTPTPTQVYTVNTRPAVLGLRENTTLPRLYFPSNPKRGRVFMYEPEGSGLVFFLISTMCTVF